MHGHWIGGTRKLNKHYQSGDDGGGTMMRIHPVFPGSGKTSCQTGFHGQYAWTWGTLEYTNMGPVFLINSSQIIGKTASELNNRGDRISAQNGSGYYTFIRNAGASGIDLASTNNYTGAPNVWIVATSGILKPYRVRLDSNTYKFRLIEKKSESDGVATMGYGDSAKLLALFEAIRDYDVSDRKGYIDTGNGWREATEEDDPSLIQYGAEPSNGFYFMAGRFNYQQIFKDRQPMYGQNMIYNASRYLPYDKEIIL